MKEELKQAIEEAYRISSSDNSVQRQIQFSKRLSVKLALSDPSILRHADPDVMKQAGWVREEDLKTAITAAWMMGQKKENNLTDCMDIILNALPQPPKQ